MDLLDRLLGHDAWTTRHLLVRCHELSDAQLDQPFDAGLGSVRATLLHAIDNTEVWTELMLGHAVSADRRDKRAPSVSHLLQRHDRASAAFGALARQLTDEGRLDDLWLDRLDDPPTTKTYGGAIGHVLTHSHFHRAELLHMLQRLGLAGLPEGDLLSWESRARRTAVHASRDDDQSTDL